jgi:hypothetical protein
MSSKPPKLPPKVEEASSAEVVVPQGLASEEERALKPLKPQQGDVVIALTEEEQRQIEIDQRRALGQLSIEEKTLLNRSLLEDIKARRKYARGIFGLICWWLASILIVLVLQGFLSERDSVKLQCLRFTLDNVYSFRAR